MEESTLNEGTDAVIQSARARRGAEGVETA